MKKVLSVLLSVLMIFSLLGVSASAVSLDNGIDALNAQFKDGECQGSLDYVYYEPQGAAEGDEKYPLFIWLHGMKSGVTPRAQLQWYGVANWSSEEYQARFTNGGCYILAPRASTSALNSWDAAMCSTLKRTIDSFIAQHADNVDTSRIYISGYSTGGSMVWDMLAAYPTFFAAALPLASIYQPTLSTLNKLSDVSVWIFSSDRDPYVLGESGVCKVTFDYLAGVSNRRESLRRTTFSEAILADGTKKTEVIGGIAVPAADAEHYIWESVTHDMFMADRVTPYLCATTFDADNNVINFTYGDAIITWLNSQSTPDEPSGDNVSFMQRVILFFNRFFAMIVEFFTGLVK